MMIFWAGRNEFVVDFYSAKNYGTKLPKRNNIIC